MKKIIALTLTLAALFTLLAVPGALADQTYTIKLGHTMSTAHPRHQALLEFEKYVEENHVTNGIITQDTAYLRTLYQELSRERKI